MYMKYTFPLITVNSHERHGVLNRRQNGCLLNSVFQLTSKNIKPHKTPHYRPFPRGVNRLAHYNDVIMFKMASQITSLTIVCSTVYSGPDQTKHQSSASLTFVRGIQMFPFENAIMGRFIFQRDSYAKASHSMPPYNDGIQGKARAQPLVRSWPLCTGNATSWSSGIS